MRTVFLNEEPRAIGEAEALARVVAEMRQQGVAALPVYDHATADGYALVRLPETLFAGEGAQRPQIRAEQKEAAPVTRSQPVASAEECCTSFTTLGKAATHFDALDGEEV